MVTNEANVTDETVPARGAALSVALTAILPLALLTLFILVRS